MTEDAVAEAKAKRRATDEMMRRVFQEDRIARTARRIFIHLASVATPNQDMAEPPLSIWTDEEAVETAFTYAEAFEAEVERRAKLAAEGGG